MSEENFKIGKALLQKIWDSMRPEQLLVLFDINSARYENKEDVEFIKTHLKELRKEIDNLLGEGK